ncbi:hypothetical protein [Afipia clevelandensis]|uniref:Uncharacterized protein n=1 Tax=Afipia clevelandensis ATCC 49720 TaxID=883079 RepID=K8P3R5_9BRAD|nr:hypothetical protein [Afipia clevelandensis]EKS35369.1 hypothetical protein HMPREF9696_02641 [Afipia clevelandensis ATCC 49720]
MNQLGFDMLLAHADQQNRDRAWMRETRHLPDHIDEGVALYRSMIEQHHQAMMDGNIDIVMGIREEARLLARRLNNGEIGYLAEGAPGMALEAETKATDGAVPLWGQTGSFVIDVDGMRVRIEMGGILSLASSVSFWPGFSANIVDLDKPFFSETGYQSFIGLQAAEEAGLTPDAFTAKVIASCVEEKRRASKRRRTRGAA